jgi:ParB family chromosome partitioning protein
MNNLGKGLQSLIPSKKPTPPRNIPVPQEMEKEEIKRSKTGNVLYIEVGRIKRNPHQPRKNLDKTRLQELADSIKEHGILQPLVVTKTGDEYEIIAGERRLEAAKIVGLPEVPVIIRDSSEQEKLELALVENLQRDNLNPVEKAYAFKKLIDEFNFIQQNVAKRIGKSRESVANTLRLLDLPAEIQRAILENKITEGHGRAILTLPNIEKQLLLFKEIIKDKLSVRQVEALARKIAKTLPMKAKPKSRKDPYLRNLEDKLSDVLGTRVKLTRKGKKGKITIEFFSQEELDSIVKKIYKKT